jgi:hypothetical protein
MTHARQEGEGSSRGRLAVQGLAQNLYGGEWVKQQDKASLRQFGVTNKRILLPSVTLSAFEEEVCCIHHT